MQKLQRLSASEIADARGQAREPLPCDECGIRVKCANEGLACEAFLIFVEVGGARQRRAARAAGQWAIAPRQPSRLIYDRLFTKRFRDDDGELTGMSVLERRAAVKKLAARGHNQRVIAELLGVVKTTVRRDLAWPNEPPHRVGPKIYKAPRESKWLIGRRAAVEELAAQGHSRRTIAATLGIDKQRVTRDLRRAHATAATAETKGRDRGRDGRYRTLFGEQRRSAVKELVATGHSACEIAGIVGVHLRTVFNDLKLLGGRRKIAPQGRTQNSASGPGPGLSSLARHPS